MDIDTNDLDDFKDKVKTWLSIDEEIASYETKIKELKKLKKKNIRTTNY